MRLWVLCFCRVVFVLCIVAGLALAMARPGLADDEKSFIATPGEAERAVSQIVEAAGRLPRVLDIRIETRRVGITAQGTDKGWHLESWSFAVAKLWFFTQEKVGGPNPARASGPVDDVESGLFELTDVRLGDAPKLARAAIERAGLEDAAHVVSMSIARSVSILPRPAYGDVRWTIEVASANEHATVYANAASQIIGADLADTHRAKTISFYTDDWPADEAHKALAAIIGHAPVVYQVGIGRDVVSADVVSPDDPEKLRTYLWGLGGTKRGLVDIPNIEKLMPSAQRLPFSFDVVDLGIIASLGKTARERLGMPNGKVTDIQAKRPTVGVNAVGLEWEVEVTDTDGSKGKVKADEKGNVTLVVLPKSRQPKLDWMAPRTIEDILQRIARTFGPNARFVDITFLREGRADIVAEDPLKPGSKAEFIIDATDIERFGSVFDPRFRPEESFTLEEAGSIDTARLKAMEDETVKRIKIDGSSLSIVIFSRGNMFVRSPRGMITVEVRVATDHDVQWGRVTFDADGHVLDVMQP